MWGMEPINQAHGCRVPYLLEVELMVKYELKTVIFQCVVKLFF